MPMSRPFRPSYRGSPFPRDWLRHYNISPKLSQQRLLLLGNPPLAFTP